MADQEINEAFVQQLVQGSKNIDYMRMAIDTVVSLIVNSRAVRKSQKLRTGGAAGYGSWAIETNCFRPYVEFSVQDGSTWVTIYSSQADAPKLASAREVEGMFDSLPTLVDTAVTIFPRLMFELQPFLDAGEIKL